MVDTPLPTTATPTPTPALAPLHERLAASLAQDGAPVQVVQTHISTVLLTGEHAYKLKKPVKLPFLDFSTLALRAHFCREELRINQRTAPKLYLNVLPVLGPAEAPRLGQPDETDGVLDWAVHMRRFPSAAVLAELAQQHTLQAEHAEALAHHLAQLHLSVPPVPSDWQAHKDLQAWAQESLDEIAQHPQRPAEWSAARHAALQQALIGGLLQLTPWRQQRRATDWVRECHGDLHLGNAVAWHGQVLAFDAIEFDADLRCIDVMNDTAFAFMDLLALGYPSLAWRFINSYVERTGDYAGLLALRAFAAYRAVVRAKVALLSANQTTVFERYIALAESLVAPPPKPQLVLTMGLSGSGKSTLAQSLVDTLGQQGPGAVRVRSDVERKRLHGLQATDRPTPTQQAVVYAADSTRRTYQHLSAQAQTLLAAGHNVVLDAAFLYQRDRAALRELAQQANAGFVLLECLASPQRMRQRLLARQAQGLDASDATPAVLDQQMANAEPVPPDWADVHVRVPNNGSLAELQAKVESFTRARF